MSGTVRLAEGIVEELESLARAGLPNEVCGLGAGTDGTITRLFPLANTAASPERYTVDPVEQLEAYRAMDDEGLEPITVYHSHPATPARPSAVDIAEAYDPDVVYLIVSLAEPVSVVRAWEIRDGRPQELIITTTEV